jgi:hypothetical protein
MLLVLDVLLIVFYYLLLRVFSVYLSSYSMYVTMSISIGLYPNLDLWNANTLHSLLSIYNETQAYEIMMCPCTTFKHLIDSDEI